VGLASPSNSAVVVSFGEFQFDLRSGELSRKGVLVKLQPQPAKILALLVARPGQVVSRTEIAEQVWGAETFVDFEHGLNFAVRQIRTALDDGAEQPRFLETVPRRGYRFIATVNIPPESPPAEPRTRDLATAKEAHRDTDPKPVFLRPRSLVVAGVLAIVILTVGWLGWRQHLRSQSSSRAIVLAVLPFDDLSPVPEQYLVEGLTEEMISRLTRINPDRMKVIARTSAMQYANTKKSAKEIGRDGRRLHSGKQRPPGGHAPEDHRSTGAHDRPDTSLGRNVRARNGPAFVPGK
jgi:DNA-binding winged helix-turn-helix (wHTH) protein